MSQNRSAVHRVYDFLKDGLWHRKHDIENHAGVQDAMRRVRDLRSPMYGGMIVQAALPHKEGLPRLNNPREKYYRLDLNSVSKEVRVSMQAGRIPYPEKRPEANPHARPTAHPASLVSIQMTIEQAKFVYVALFSPESVRPGTANGDKWAIVKNDIRRRFRDKFDELEVDSYTPEAEMLNDESCPVFVPGPSEEV